MIQLSFYGNTLTRRFTHPSKAQVCKAQPHIFYRKFFYKLSKAAINTQQRCLSVVLSMCAQTRIRVFLFRQSVHQNQKIVQQLYSVHCHQFLLLLTLPFWQRTPIYHWWPLLHGNGVRLTTTGWKKVLYQRILWNIVFFWSAIHTQYFFVWKAWSVNKNKNLVFFGKGWVG